MCWVPLLPEVFSFFRCSVSRLSPSRSCLRATVCTENRVSAYSVCVLFVCLYFREFTNQINHKFINVPDAKATHLCTDFSFLRDKMFLIELSIEEYFPLLIECTSRVENQTHKLNRDETLTVRLIVFFFFLFFNFCFFLLCDGCVCWQVFWVVFYRIIWKRINWKWIQTHKHLVPLHGWKSLEIYSHCR